MGDQASERMHVAATPQRCFEVAADIEHYPQWASEIKEVNIVERDSLERPVVVHFRTAAFGRSTSYTLRYDYSKGPHSLSWKLIEGDMNKLDGCYEFDANSDGGTEVTYHLEVELRAPMPGFIKTRAQSRIMTAALDDLKAQAESCD